MVDDWSTTCKQHHLQIQCKLCCTTPAGNDAMVLSDSDEDEDEDEMTARNAQAARSPFRIVVKNGKFHRYRKSERGIEVVNVDRRMTDRRPPLT